VRYVPGASGAAFAVTGYTRPALKVSGCLVSMLEVPRGFEGWVAGPVTVRFVVNPDGSVSRFMALTDAPVRILRAIERAVASCEWSPGANPEGVPVPIWVIQPFRFVQG
jgi:hypothetical protein